VTCPWSVDDPLVDETKSHQILSDRVAVVQTGVAARGLVDAAALHCAWVIVACVSSLVVTTRDISNVDILIVT